MQSSPAATAAPADVSDRDAYLALHVAIAGLCGLTVTVIWAAASSGAFWPRWVWFGLAPALGLHAAIWLALRHPPGWRRRLLIHAEISALIALILLDLWLMTGGGTFWVAWPCLGLGAALALHLTVAVFLDKLDESSRERELVDRVDVLTRTRRGALDVQAAELRRIERDLHDGAQSRLVALTMQLGRAEARLDDRPEVAELVRQAREEAGAAIAELRDLARGIAPPVLADRGLAAAAEALGRRAPMPVEVDVQLERRLPPVVEAAAYFVVAESLTNVAKHAPGATAQVALLQGGGKLTIMVADDGPGGADPDGGGLTGLRHRIEALDGTLAVESPAGGGTRISAELPCGS